MAHQAEVHAITPLFIGEREERFGGWSAGVGDHGVEPAELGVRSLHEGGDGSAVADVHGLSEDVGVVLRPQFVHGPIELVGGSRADREFRALLCEAVGRGLAQTFG